MSRYQICIEGGLNPALAKERAGFGGAGPEDDSKFSGNWRREGPLPSFGDSHESSRRRFDSQPGERPPPSGVSDEASDWRSSRPLSKVAESEAPSARRRGSGFSITEGQAGAADREEHWTLGSRFKPSAPEESVHGKLGSVKGKPESIHARDAPDEGDWRAPRRAPGGSSREYPRQHLDDASLQLIHSDTASSSTPPTPQIGRKKLELLPRTSTGSASPSPLSSPKLASNVPRPSPFGAAKSVHSYESRDIILTRRRPVDISVKEREITARLEHTKDRGPQDSMSRTNSRQATERPTHPTKVSSTSPSAATPPASSAALAASTVRPAFSFAKAAAVGRSDDEKATKEDTTSAVDNVTDQVLESA